MIAGVRSVADETVLVEVADIDADLLAQWNSDRHGVAHPVIAMDPLKTGRVEINEAFMTGRQRDFTAQREDRFDLRSNPPAGGWGTRNLLSRSPTMAFITIITRLAR